jgi:5-methylcytosine-specific restriction endonuclease McrA
MANSKRRCRFCREYFPTAQFLRGAPFCSAECMAGKLVAERRPRPATPQKTRTRTRSLPAHAKVKIRSRDGDACRFCGITRNLHVHHIDYLSQGGSSEPHNLVTLCGEHHALVHSDKRTYQPICRAYIWSLYVEGKRRNLPQLMRRVAELMRVAA